MRLAHADSRRQLYEWPVAKRLLITEDCIIGGHYHLIKTELFVLTRGDAVMHVRNGWDGPETGETLPMTIGHEYTVEPGTWHEFDITAGSVLICLASHTHDPDDDYQA